MSQEMLAADAGVTATYVSQIETQTYNPTIGVLDKLAVALKVDVCEFLAAPEHGAVQPGRLRSGPKPK